MDDKKSQDQQSSQTQDNKMANWYRKMKYRCK
ncbi:hypothetical protein SAMN06298211_10230 [Prevotellaceae bacterium MN60]|nr:hypothetical protein SAMN06298211_10230 [Prevotellaceae bacterium MN60]